MLHVLVNKTFQEENNTDVPNESAFRSHEHGDENITPQRNTMTYLFSLVIIMFCHCANRQRN